MKDLLLYAAGLLGILVSLIHGRLGETKVIAPLTAPHRMTLRINRAVFHLSTLYWAGAGIALLMAPLTGSPLRPAIAWTAAAVYCAGAAANGWATRGKHFGAYALLVVALLASLGA